MADKVVYFTGCFSNYYQPDIGKAFVAVMQKNGFEIIVPEQKCCGMPMMANSNRQGAKSNFDFNVQSLAKAASSGYDILTTCPSCNMMLRKEGLGLFDSEEARFVSEHIYDAGEYLARLREEGRLNTNFGEVPEKVYYHNPCHLKIQDIAPLALLQLVPGLQLLGVNRNCCGMSGSYGLKVVNYQRSTEIAQKVWGEVRDAHPEFVVTECGGCGLQIEAGTGVAIKHPMVVLNQAYNAFTNREAA